MRIRHLASALVCVAITSTAFAGMLDAFTEKDASGGLKQALTQGAEQAVSLLGKQDGFLGNPKIRIPLPEGLKKAEQALRLMGRGKDVDELETAINRAAEQAVPEAKTLLVNAVKQMSVQDAKNILTGGDDSATQYFRQKTSGTLTQRFLPVVTKVTSRSSLSNQYNKLAGQAASFGLINAEDARVEDYVTRKALDGLYLTIAEQERAIRRDPVSAVGNLAKKVFGALQ